MKKVTRTLLTIAIVSLLVLAFGACDATCEHEWVDADCTTPKTCSKCDETEGEALGHTEVTDAAVDATCTATGLTEGTHCSECGTVLAEQTVIGALGHDLYSYNAKDPDCVNAGYKAYEACSRGDYTTYEEIAATGVHTGGEATCKDKAVCTGCNQPYGELDANNHKNTIALENTAVEATCGTAGKKADTYCNDCQKTVATGADIPATGSHSYIEDNDCTKANVCSCGASDGNASSAHTYADGDNDCSTAETCSAPNCNAVNPTVKEHDFPENENDCTATVKCNNCNVTKPGNASHTGGTATCIKKAECEVCGSAYGDYAAHNYTDAQVAYTWSDDLLSCTATHNCVVDNCGAPETATAQISSEITQIQTGDNPEITTYTATFTEAWAAEQTKDKETKPAFGYNGKAENGEKLAVNIGAANADVSVGINYAIAENATLLIYSGADDENPAELNILGSSPLAWQTASFETTAGADGYIYIAVKANDGTAPTLLIDQIAYLSGGLNDKMLREEVTEGDGKNTQTLTVNTVYADGASVAVSASSSHESHATTSVAGNVVTVTATNGEGSWGGVPTISVEVSLGGNKIIGTSYTVEVYVPITTTAQLKSYMEDYPGGRYMLMNDLTIRQLKEDSSGNYSSDFSSVTTNQHSGYSFTTGTFSGVLDGNGYTINVETQAHWGTWYNGIKQFFVFRDFNNATIRNLGLDVKLGTYVENGVTNYYGGTLHSAFLAYTAASTTIENCFIRGEQIENHSNQWAANSAFYALSIDTANVIKDSFVDVNIVGESSATVVELTVADFSFVREGANVNFDNVWGLTKVQGVATTNTTGFNVYSEVSSVEDKAALAGTVSELEALGYDATNYDGSVWEVQEDGTVALKNGCSLK